MKSTILAGLAGVFAGMALPIPMAQAESAVALRSAVFVERADLTRGAVPARRIEPAARLVRGERVVLVLDWQTRQNNPRFLVTAPVPPSLAFEKSSSGQEEISVDGGRSWGRLGSVQIADQWGTRIASPQDATHVRWRVDGSAGQGRITYSAFVR